MQIELLRAQLRRFEVAIFDNRGDRPGENTGDYHNPTRQRGIYGNTGKTLLLDPSLTGVLI
jgi:hypothetical protein